jgi:hypothetical protein
VEVGGDERPIRSAVEVDALVFGAEREDRAVVGKAHGVDPGRRGERLDDGAVAGAVDLDLEVFTRGGEPRAARRECDGLDLDAAIARPEFHAVGDAPEFDARGAFRTGDDERAVRREFGRLHGGDAVVLIDAAGGIAEARPDGREVDGGGEGRGERGEREGKRAGAEE